MGVASASTAPPCEWCVSFSGMTKKGRACCELRALAAMPKASRQEVYAKVLRESGAEAAEKLKADVLAEYRRKREQAMAITREAVKGSSSGNIFA